MADSLWPSCTATNAGETPGGAAGFADGDDVTSRRHQGDLELVPRLPHRDHDATRPPPRRAGLQRIASTDLLPIVDDHHHHHHTIDHDEVRVKWFPSTWSTSS